MIIKPDIQLKATSILITIIIALVGFLGSWYTVKANVNQIQSQQTQSLVKIEKTEGDVSNIKVREAEQTQIVKQLCETLKKIESQTSVLPKMQADLEVLKEKR